MGASDSHHLRGTASLGAAEEAGEGRRGLRGLLCCLASRLRCRHSVLLLLLLLGTHCRPGQYLEVQMIERWVKLTSSHHIPTRQHREKRSERGFNNSMGHGYFLAVPLIDPFAVTYPLALSEPPFSPKHLPNLSTELQQRFLLVACLDDVRGQGQAPYIRVTGQESPAAPLPRSHQDQTEFGVRIRVWGFDMYLRPRSAASPGAAPAR